MPKKSTLIYKQIPDFQDYFAASNGKIYSVKKKKDEVDNSKPHFRELTVYIQPGSKYLSVNIIRNKEKISFNVHKLIGWAFTGNNPFDYCFYHKRKNYLNNKPENLDYFKFETDSENENRLKEIELKEFECLFKRAVNYDYRNKIWKNYEVLKLKDNTMLLINFIKIFLRTKGYKMEI